jgi:HK97 gp10 family phage protein
MASQTVTFTIKGGAELQRDMDRLGADLAIKAQKSMLRRAAQPIQDEMVRMCPVGPTGNLANSIKTTVNKRKDAPGFQAVVGPRAPHAHLIHMGHRTRVPRKGYGGKLQYWGKYWSHKMYGEFIKGGAMTARPNPFVTVAFEKTRERAVTESVEHLREVIARYQKRMPNKGTAA